MPDENDKKSVFEQVPREELAKLLGETEQSAREAEELRHAIKDQKRAPAGAVQKTPAQQAGPFSSLLVILAGIGIFWWWFSQDPKPNTKSNTSGLGLAESEKSQEPAPADPAPTAATQLQQAKAQEEISASTRARDEATHARTEQLKKAGAQARLREAKTFASACVATDACPTESVVALIGSSADQKDGALIGSIVGAALAAFAVKQATDGAELSAKVIAKAAEMLLANGKAGLLHLPSCNRGTAMKDPAAQRGKVITASGQVVQIHRDGPVFVGTLTSDSLKAVYFVTPFNTDKIEEGSYATFRGIFVQEYDYPNVSGGETQAVALLGAFD